MRFLLLLMIIGATIRMPLSSMTIYTTHQAWVCYNLKTTLPKNWWLSTEVEQRGFLKPATPSNFFIRSSLNRKLSKGFSLGAGFSYWVNHLQGPVYNENLAIPELRPFQDVFHEFKKERIYINQRLRTEQRLMHLVSANELGVGYRFLFRARYRLLLGITAWEKPAKNLKIDFRLSDELMVQTGKNVTTVFEQHRIGAGLYAQLHRHAAVELSYINWFQQRLNIKNEFYLRHIYKVTLFHLF